VQVVGTPSAIQLHEVTALAAALCLKSTSKVCPLEMTSKDRTRWSPKAKTKVTQ